MPQISLTIRALACLLLVFLPLNNLDLWLYDSFFQLRGKSEPEPTITLVWVDAQATAAAPLATADFQSDLDASPTSHAPVNPGLTHLSDWMSWINRYDAKYAVLSFVISSEQYLSLCSKQKDLLFSVSRSGAQNAYDDPPLQASFNDLMTDTDGVVRKAKLAESELTSLALRTFYRTQSGTLDLDLVTPIWINYQGRSGSFAQVEVSELQEKDFDKTRIQGQILILGDRNQTAMTPYGRMPKAEIHANILSTLVHDNNVRVLPLWTSQLLSLFIIAVSVSLILVLPLKIGWICLIALASLLFVSAFLLFSAGSIWIGISNAIVAILGSHLFVLGYKLEREEEQQWRIKQESIRLKEMDQFKNNFISLFSHDLKTPISKINAIISQIRSKDPQLSLFTAESLKSIEKSNGQLARLISDILKVTRMESNELKAVKESVDLNRLLENASEDLKFTAQEKNIRIQSDLEPLFPLEGDNKLLQEVVFNLMENAIKYSAPDTTVTATTAEKDDRVYVTVSDQGPGIDQEELSLVTKKFYRGKSQSQTTKGSGLGLYLASYFVDLHGGRLALESRLGHGTTASFWLPLS